MKHTAFLLPAALLGCAVANAWAGPKSGWVSVAETRFYSATPVAGDNTVYPMRGYHRWQNQELVPQTAPALDSFRRYYWRIWKAPRANTTSRSSSTTCGRRACRAASSLSGCA